MLFLIGSIIASTAIMIIFRTLENFKIPLFQAIVLNYFAASILGFLLVPVSFNFQQIINSQWFWFAAVIGFMLIVMFYIIGTSTQKAGVTPTTVASKMSVIIPISFSIFYYAENVTVLKIFAILVALLAVVFSSLKKRDNTLNYKYIILPFILFFGAGFLDTLVKIAQQEYLTQSSTALFSAVTFSFAAFFGLCITIIRKEKILTFFYRKTLLMGGLLGVANFFSMYLLIIALSSGIFESSVVFGLNNTGIVALSVVSAIIFFREKLTIINWLGLLLTFISIVMLTFIG